MSRFRTPYNFKNEGLGENPQGTSMAEPDQSLTVKEILERFTSGTLTEEEVSLGQPFYNDDIDHPVPNILDITDIEDMARDKKAILDDMQRQQEEYKKKQELNNETQ